MDLPIRKFTAHSNLKKRGHDMISHVCSQRHAMVEKNIHVT